MTSATLRPTAPPDAYKARLIGRAIAFVIVCMFAAMAAFAVRPEKEIASLTAGNLETIIPPAFGDWRVDTSIVPVVPDPTTLAAVNRIYSDTLARTYVNSSGERVMLSLAYGRRQNDTMRLHQPEGCYMGQGFGVRQLGLDKLDFGHRVVPVVRLHASLGRREEPITYWMVVGGGHAVTQTQAKLAQLRFGLKGYVPDGLLFRISSIGSDSEAGFRVQDEFARQLVAAVPAAVRNGLLGS